MRPSRERANAVRRALKGYPGATLVVRAGAYSAEHGYEATLAIFEESPQPTAIIVGGNRRAVRRMGFKPASTLADALEMAEDQVGRDPTITYFHCPPVMLANVS